MKNTNLLGEQEVESHAHTGWLQMVHSDIKSSQQNSRLTFVNFAFTLLELHCKSDSQHSPSTISCLQSLLAQNSLRSILQVEPSFQIPRLDTPACFNSLIHPIQFSEIQIPPAPITNSFQFSLAQFWLPICHIISLYSISSLKTIMCANHFKNINFPKIIIYNYLHGSICRHQAPWITCAFSSNHLHKFCELGALIRS